MRNRKCRTPTAERAGVPPAAARFDRRLCGRRSRTGPPPTPAWSSSTPNARRSTSEENRRLFPEDAALEHHGLGLARANLPQTMQQLRLGGAGVNGQEPLRDSAGGRRARRGSYRRGAALHAPLPGSVGEAPCGGEPLHRRGCFPCTESNSLGWQRGFFVWFRTGLRNGRASTDLCPRTLSPFDLRAALLSRPDKQPTRARQFSTKSTPAETSLASAAGSSPACVLGSPPVSHS